MDTDRRELLAGMLVSTGLAMMANQPVMAARTRKFGGVKDASAILIRDPDGRDAMRYLFGALPAGEKGPAVPGTAYTHPLWTPGGEIVTDVAAPDHPHHRGVFCAWINVDGEKRGDWWGWGARAPKDGRAIVSRSAKLLSTGRSSAALEAVNAWQADGVDVLIETIQVTASQQHGCNILDYIYTFMPATNRPVTIAQNPFGGFCYRAKPRGAIVISDPSGPLDLKDSWQDSYELNWPARPWYDFSTTAPDGKVAGGAVLDHPGNPPSTWHIIRGAYMVNPCIVAPGAIEIQPGNGLTLRHRVVSHDGPADAAVLNRLHREFARS